MQKHPSNLFLAWMTAIRVRSLPIPTIQVVVGTALAYAATGKINWTIALFIWLVAVFITIGTNLVNDVIDFERGGDSLKRAGHVKVIRAGIISKTQVLIAGIGAFCLALICGIPLALHSGWMLYLLVLLSVIAGYCYTGGPYPISYNGLSELFVLIFYGGVCVGAAFYVQAGVLTAPLLLCSLQMGLLAILPNALNNFRDIYDDAEVNKRTLAVRFGKTFARWEIATLTFLPFVLNLFWICLGYLAASLLPLLLLPVAFLFVRSVWTTDPGPLFNRYFGLSVLTHFLFGLLLTLGLFLR